MTMNFNMCEVVRDYLDRHEWKYSYISEKNIIRCGVNIKSKLKSVQMFIDFKARGFAVIAVPTLSAGQDTMDEVMRYLTRANYGLLDGNFELDLNDGEIRYKAYVPCAGLNMLPDSIIEEALAVPPLMFQKFGDGLAAVALGFSDGETAYRKTQA